MAKLEYYASSHFAENTSPNCPLVNLWVHFQIWAQRCIGVAPLIVVPPPRCFVICRGLESRRPFDEGCISVLELLQEAPLLKKEISEGERYYNPGLVKEGKLGSPAGVLCNVSPSVNVHWFR